MSKASVKAKLVMAQALASFMDSGPNSATITFYCGVKPANTETTTDQNNALVTLEFPKPCFKEVTATYVELLPTNTAIVIKTGTVVWARICNGSDEVVVDLVVDEDISLANTNLALGGTLSVKLFRIRP